MNNPADTLAALAALAEEVDIADDRYVNERKLAKWADQIRTLAAALASLKGEAEPVAWGRWAEGLPPGTRLLRYDGLPAVHHNPSDFYNVPLYTAPPSPQAVGGFERAVEQMTGCKFPPSPAPQGGGEAAHWKSITDRLKEEVDGYEFRGDEGDYTPNERERMLLLDFAMGLPDELLATPPAQQPGEVSVPHWALPAVENALNLLDHYGFMHTDLAAVRDWLKERT